MRRAKLQSIGKELDTECRRGRETRGERKEGKEREGVGDTLNAIVADGVVSCQSTDYLFWKWLDYSLTFLFCLHATFNYH